VGDCVWLLRHGATEWTASELHTGARDVSLSDEGREQARQGGKLLAGRRFGAVLVSPQTRAIETCRLAGFADVAEVCDDLVEWDYGEYEGLTDEESQAHAPGWDLFRDGAPGGETPKQVSDRVDRAIAAVLEAPGPRLVVGHGKLLRAFAARWIGSEIELGSHLPLDTAAVCILEREAGTSLLRLWNWQGQLPRA